MFSIPDNDCLDKKNMEYEIVFNLVYDRKKRSVLGAKVIFTPNTAWLYIVDNDGKTL